MTVNALLVLAATIAPSHAQEWNPPNLVANPGFEDVTTAGFPQGWSGDAKVYSSVTAPVHSGQRALQFVNSDPERYLLCTQSVPLKRGRIYEVSVWVKTEGIEGDDTGATVCLEWYTADGKYIGGCYPAGIKGTRDWTQIKTTSGRIPANAANCSVVCYVRQHMTGKAWWDDVEVRQWREPPLHTMLLEPHYRGEIGPERRPIEVAATLKLADYDLKPSGVTLRAEVTGQAKTVATQETRPRSAEVTLRLPSRGLASGKCELRVTLVERKDHRPLASETWPLRVVEAADLAGRVSYLDEHNRLIREGKPFFPLGMYWGGIEEADLRLYADSPFNCLMPYGAPDKAKMDLAQSLGLKVIYSVKDIYHGSEYCPKDIKTTDDERRFIEARAKELRDHPALLAWYLNDELSLDYLDRLEAHQQWLEELDPGHPTWVVLYQVGEVESYVRTFDAIGTDPYPIPEAPARRAGDWTRTTVQGVHDRRPVWMVPQVFDWGCYRTRESEKAGLRPPTLPEMRSMAWQCIAEGAKGLIFYSFFDLRRDTTVPFDEQWSKVKEMAAEIKAMAPVILSTEPTPPISAPPADWLHWTTRRVGRTVYLMAVNDERVAHRASFELGRTPKRVRLAGADAKAEVHGTHLEAELDRFGVNIYQLEF